MRSFYSVLFFLSVCVSSISAGAQHVAVKLPLHAGSVRFAVIGDSGTGNKEQFEVAQELERYRQDVKFDFVIMLGDNIYGGHSASDFKRKFEEP